MTSTSPTVSRVGSSASAAGAHRVLLAGLAFLVLALVKPWGGDQPGGGPAAPMGNRAVAPAPSGGNRPDAAAASSPSPAQRSPGPDEIACSPGGWEIVTLDRLAHWTVRTWIPVTPVAAGGPLDPAIPLISLESPIVLSVGVCGPAAGPDGTAGMGAMLVASAWQIGDGRATPLRISSRRPGPLDAGLARLYSPVAGGPDGSWPAGRFVLELSPLGASQSEAAASAGPRSPLRWYVGVSVGPAANAG